jgi:tRNA(His) guanylyltransferase
LLIHFAQVMEELGDVVLAFGMSDEFSFVLRKDSALYSRRRSKIESAIVSLFSASFVFLWPRHLPDVALQYPPSFDARSVAFPNDRVLRDYLSWRQVDCHINCLYNECYWRLVQGGMAGDEAARLLAPTQSKDKHELLFSRFKINYAQLPAVYRKGSVLIRRAPAEREEGDAEAKAAAGQGDRAQADDVADRLAGSIVMLHEDIIEDAFWTKNAHVLAPVSRAKRTKERGAARPGKPPQQEEQPPQ